MQSNSGTAQAGVFLQWTLPRGLRLPTTPVNASQPKPPHRQIPMVVNRQPSGPQVLSWEVLDAGPQRARE